MNKTNEENEKENLIQEYKSIKNEYEEKKEELEEWKEQRIEEIKQEIGIKELVNKSVEVNEELKELRDPKPKKEIRNTFYQIVNGMTTRKRTTSPKQVLTIRNNNIYQYGRSYSKSLDDLVNYNRNELIACFEDNKKRKLLSEFMNKIREKIHDLDIPKQKEEELPNPIIEEGKWSDTKYTHIQVNKRYRDELGVKIVPENNKKSYKSLHPLEEDLDELTIEILTKHKDKILGLMEDLVNEAREKKKEIEKLEQELINKGKQYYINQKLGN